MALFISREVKIQGQLEFIAFLIWRDIDFALFDLCGLFSLDHVSVSVSWRQFIKNPTDLNRQNFVSYRNKFKSIKTKAIKDFYSSKFDFLMTKFGFRKGQSTSMAPIHLRTKIAKSIDQNKFSIGVFLDLAKVFDTVNHVIFLRKLDYYGIRGIALEWFKSYLSNGTQQQFIVWIRLR